MSSEDDLVIDRLLEVVVLERIRVVPVPWIVVPPKLVSLSLVLCRDGVGAGETAIPRADASFESPCRRSTIAFKSYKSLR